MKPMPFMKRPKRSNPLKWAAWGAFVGLAVIAVRADYGVLIGEPTSLSAASVIGGFIGGAVGGAFLAGIAAFIRNLFIR